MSSPIHEFAKMAEGSDGAAIAPLMRESEDDPSNDQQVTHIYDGDLTSPSTFTWTLSATAGISGILFGYE